MRIGSASACVLVTGLALTAGAGARAQNETGEEGGR